MRAYRLRRNLEASFIEFFREALAADDWKNVQVEYNLKADDIKLPAIMIFAPSVENIQREVGTGKYLKYPVVNIKIFAKSDGMRTDLADWMKEKFEGDIPYYKYTIEDGDIISKNLAGNIVVRKINRDEKELANTDPNVLEVEDRYRHLFELSVYVAESVDC